MKAVRKSVIPHTRLGGVEKSNREDFLTADEDSRLTGTDIQTQHPPELLGTRQKEIGRPPALGPATSSYSQQNKGTDTFCEHSTHF